LPRVVRIEQRAVGGCDRKVPNQISSVQVPCCWSLQKLFHGVPSVLRPSGAKAAAARFQIETRGVNVK
jgi:hypothetical protein